MATGALIEEVAENLEEAAELTRKIDSRAVGILLGGIGVGFAIGFYFGHRYNKEKIRLEAFKESEIELDKIREVYRQKVMVAEPKPSVQELIDERGYSVKAPEPEHRLPAPVPIREKPTAVEPTAVESDEPDWIYSYELSKRTPEHPYVIHQDEFMAEEREGYSQVSYTYYEADDVLCAEDDKPLAHRDLTVGQDNLRFGHGSTDPNVVYVRNDRLELEMEITRSSGSYEEEVMGLDPELEHGDDYETRRRHRRSHDDDDSD